MSLDRALLIRGPAKVTFGAGTFHAREDIKPHFLIDWREVNTSVFNIVDKWDADRRIVTPVKLWGAYENLSILFPSSYLTPVVGTQLYGSSDSAAVIHSTNTDRLQLFNTQITKLSNLFLGVDRPIFDADLEFTTLIKNLANPEDAAAYHTLDTLAYSDTTFAKTNFKAQRYSAAWGSVTGFSAFQAKEGWQIEWELRLAPDKVDGLGTVGMILLGLTARARCIPVEPTTANLLTALNFEGTSNPLGRLLSRTSGDLVITGSGVSITLKNAGITDTSLAFGGVPIRNGEVTWETTVGFAAGVAAARAVVA